MSQVASCLSKFHAREIERRRILNLANMYKDLWQVAYCRSLWTWIWELLHATEALRLFHVTCNTSMPGSTFENGKLFVRAQGVRGKEVRSHDLRLALSICAVSIFRCDLSGHGS